MQVRIFSCCLTAAVIALSSTQSARATGQFLNLPTYFGHTDTSRVILNIGQSLVKGEYENSTVFAFDIGFRSEGRTRARIQVFYPVIQQDGMYNHGFADLLMSGHVSILSDSLKVSGLFLRGDMRIPTGSASLWPYAGESLNGGGGLEARKISEIIDLRCSVTYILSGRKVEEEAMRQENYALASLLVGIQPYSTVSINLSIFGQFFRNGDYREVYLLGAGVHLNDQIDIRLSGGVDSGGSFERVWNSMVQLALTWRFPGGAAQDGPAPEDVPDYPTHP